MKRLLFLLICCVLLTSCNLKIDSNDDLEKKESVNDKFQEQIFENVSDVYDDSVLNLTIDDYSDEYGVGINSNNFPDKYLRYYVREECDADSNNYLSSNEILNITDFNSSQDYTYFHKIENFKGLEIFTNLEEICVSFSETIDSFDFSQFANLEKVVLSKNRISDIDFSNNNRIKYLYIEDMLGDSIDIHGCDSKILICVENNIICNTNPYTINVSDCSFFSDYTSLFLNIIDSGLHPDIIVRPFIVMINNNEIMYYNGNPTKIESSFQDDSAIYTNGLFFKGQGTDYIKDNSVFFDLNQAFEYGMCSNSWFTLNDFYLVKKETCKSCGIPILESNEGITYASVLVDVVESPY